MSAKTRRQKNKAGINAGQNPTPKKNKAGINAGLVLSTISGRLFGWA